MSLLKPNKIDRAKTCARFAPAVCAPHKRGLNPFFLKKGVPFSFPYIEAHQYRICWELKGPDTKFSLKCAISYYGRFDKYI